MELGLVSFYKEPLNFEGGNANRGQGCRCSYVFFLLLIVHETISRGGLFKDSFLMSLKSNVEN